MTLHTGESSTMANPSEVHGANSGVQSSGSNQSSWMEILQKNNISKKKAMFTLVLSVFVDMLGYTLVLPLLPSIAKNLGASDFLIGIIISSNAITALVFGPIMGRLSDRFGRKPILMICQIGTVCSFLLLATANDIPGLFLARFADGVFSGQIPILRAYIADMTDTEPEKRAKEMSKFGIGFASGMILGPALGGLLSIVHVQFPAFFSAGVAVVATILTYTVLIESMPKQRILFLKQQREALKLNGEFRKIRLFSWQLVLRLAQFFMLVLAFNAFISTLPIYLDERFHVESFQIGLLFSCFGIASVLVAGVIMIKVTNRFGEKKSFVFSLILQTGLFLLYPLIPTFELLFLFVIFPAFANNVTRPIINSGISKAAPKERQGEAAGYGSNMQSFAQIFAPLVASYFLDLQFVPLFGLSVPGYVMVALFCTIVAIVSLVLGTIDAVKFPESFAQAGKVRRSISIV